MSHNTLQYQYGLLLNQLDDLRHRYDEKFQKYCDITDAVFGAWLKLYHAGKKRGK